jgi:hypothetical protein
LADKSAIVEVTTAVVNSGNSARFVSTTCEPCPNANNAKIINRREEVVVGGTVSVKTRDAAIKYRQQWIRLKPAKKYRE